MFFLCYNKHDEWVIKMGKKKREKKEEKIQKKKISKKIIIILSSIFAFIIIALGVGGYFFYQSKILIVKLKKNIELSLNEEYFNTDSVIQIKNGELLTKKEKVDTTKIGSYKVTLKVKDYFKKEKKYTYEVNVIDKEAPKIAFNPKLSIEEGNEMDLLKDVSAEDDSKEEIKVTVEGEYDFNTPGTYELNYVAKDSSGNEAKEAFTLEVTKKPEAPKPVYAPPIAAPTATDGSFTTSNGHHGVISGGVTYIDGVLIANKTYSLPASYNPGGLNGEMYAALQRMFADAAGQGINLWIKSGFRSYSTQQGTYSGWVSRYGQATADTISARPGHSEHQSGLAADINSLDQSFEYTAEGQWLNNNCANYGFIIRYVKGKENETGYAFEPWHVRYVGSDLAKKLYNGGNWITLENYFGITSYYQ